MIPNLRLISGPTEWPVSLEEAKVQCSVDHNDHDAFIEGLIQFVANWLAGPKGWLGRALCRQTMELELPAWPCRQDINLPSGPVTETGGAVVSVKYWDSSNVEQTVSPSNYLVVGDNLAFLSTFARPATFCRQNAVTIRYTAGYEDPADLDWGIRHAIKMLVASHYFQRGDMVPSSLVMDRRIEEILTRYRLFWTP